MKNSTENSNKEILKKAEMQKNAKIVLDNAKNKTSNPLEKLTESEADKVIADSKKSISDAELLALTSKVNKDALLENTIANRSIWNTPRTDNNKGTFTKLRREQIKLSKDVIKYNVLLDKVNSLTASKLLFDFYKKNLISLSVYSNVSMDKGQKAKDKRIILDSAYNVMKVYIKF